MSTINQIQLPNGSTYDFEDTAAREEASSKADKTLATTSANGLMSAADKSKLDGIDPSAITTNAANIKKNADAISAETARAKKAEEANATAISRLNSPENPSLLNSENDLNNVVTGGFYHIDNGYNPANMPSGNDNAVLLVMQGRDHADIAQILISGNSDNILYRTGNTLNKFWADWRKLANTQDLDAINKVIQGVSDSRTSYVNCGVLVAADMDAFALNCGSLIKSANPFDTCGFTSGMFQAVHEGDDYYYGLWYILSATEVDLVFFKQRADTMIKYKITGDSIVSKYVYQNVSTLSARVDALASDVAVRASLIPTGTAIYAGDDLNNISYTAVGTYYCSAIVEAQHISNLPEATAFMMTVYNPLGTLTEPLTTPWQYRVQEFMPYYGTNKYIRMVYTNVESNVTFTDWVKQTYSNDLGAVSKIINDHIANKSNPHAVTKAQVGLGSVANLDQSKAIKSITRSGTTFTATALDGTTTTFTQQDGSTTYSVATSSADGLMSKEDKTKLDSLSDSGIHYVPFKLVDDYTCSTTDSFDTVMSMVQANKPVQALVNADGKVISLPVFMYDAGSEEIMFRNDEMYIIWASTAEMIGDIILALYGYTLSDKLQDNDTTETSGQAALDAHMGKVLSDRINAVKTGAIDQLAKNTAQIETAGTATNAHSAGEYVMISNALYKVAASVAKGDTWTIGTNVTAANIGSEISSLKSDLVNKLYPVGSIYMSVNATNPAELFGGTWEQIKDRFMLACGDTYAAGSTGGEAQHTHKYGIQFGEYYGAISMIGGQAGVLQGGKNPAKLESAGFFTTDINNGAVDQRRSVSTMLHYKSIADTSSASNMPPYLAVYVWKRTA